MKRNILIAGVVATSLIATAGMAAAFGNKGGERMGPRGMMPNFEEIDTNGDGKLTKDEMQAHFKARFDAADTNGDGELSPGEMQAVAQAKRAERGARMLDKFDANGDGALSLEEMPGQGGRAGKMFDRVDADGDGAITKEEMAKMAGQGGNHRGMMHGRKKCD